MRNRNRWPLALTPILLVATTSAADERTLVVSGVIAAPAHEIFASFKTPEGIVKAWGVAKASVDFRIGGQIRTAYNAETDLDSPRAIRQTILAYEPDRMLAIKSTAPEGAPDWLRAICESGWWVIRLEPLGPDRTRYTETGLGFKDGALFDQAYEFFQRGNEATLRHMQAAFAPADGAARTDAAWKLLTSLQGGCWVHESTRPDGGMFRARTELRPILDGSFISAHGWIGDASGLHDHARMVYARDGATGGITFTEFHEGGGITRGSVRLLETDILEHDWAMVGADGTRETYLVRLVIQGPDAYTMRLWPSADAAAKGEKPMLDVPYRRVTEPPATHRVPEDAPDPRQSHGWQPCLPIRSGSPASVGVPLVLDVGRMAAGWPSDPRLTRRLRTGPSSVLTSSKVT